MCTFVRKVQEDSAAESAGLTAGEPPTSSAHVSYTHKTVRPYDTFQLNTKIDRYVTYQHAHTHPPTYTHIAMDKYNAKSCLSSRNWRVPVFCILIYCRGHHHYYKWCQYRRIISSAHTWSDQRVNQQLTPQLKSCFREKCRLFLKLLNKELKVVSGTYSTKSAITQPSRVGRRRHKHKNLLISTRRRRERSVGPPMVFMLDLCLVSGCQVARRLANGRSGILMLHLWEILVM